MQNMKKLLLVVAAALAVGCTNKTNQAQECAQQFLDAFLANEYDAAAKLCSDDFQVDFAKATEDYRNMSEDIKALLVEQCNSYKAVITSVERINSSDTFVVNYNIVKPAADSSAFEKGLISSSLKIVEGKVQQLDK